MSVGDVGNTTALLLKHPMSSIVDLAANPRQLWMRLWDNIVDERERRGPHCRYIADVNGERHVHEFLQVPWSCRVSSDFWMLWSEVIAEPEQKGLRADPKSFQAWNDGDAAFVRAIWCLVHHLNAHKIC